MPLENAQYIAELNPAWPLGSDPVNTSDDHHRNTKRATQQSFPNIDAEVTATAADLNTLTGAASTGSPYGLNPVGTRIEGYWTTAPNGYLVCDGSAIDPQYTALIAILGPNLPDERGRFARGWSEDNSVDPDGPRAPLSTQQDDFKSHDHTQRSEAANAGNQGTFIGHGINNASTTNRGKTLTTGGAETRPKNTAVLVCVKW